MGKRGWGVVLVLALLGGAGAAHAGTTREEVRKQVEASMLVQGTVDIDAQGHVTTYRIEQADALAKVVLDVVDRQVRGWRFEPVIVGGQAVPARAPMQLRLVSKPEGDGFLLRIAGASFGETYGEGETAKPRGKLSSPRYPRSAQSAGVGGTVYLVLRVGREGAVEDAVAEQVNLRAIGSEREMALLREILTKAAIKASEDWKFDFPTRGEDRDAPFLSVRVPVDFVLSRKAEKMGEWYAYVPGPRQVVPWRTWDASYQAPDALAAGAVYPDRPDGLRLRPSGG